MTTHPQSHTTIVRTDFAPDEVIVRGGDGRWFRVLNWFYDEIVPTLDGTQTKVMLGIMRHRDNETGLSRVARSEIARHLRQAKGTISDAVKGLLAHPLSLLAEHPAIASFEVFPGHGFAGRVRQAEPKFDISNCGSTNRTDVIAHIGNARASRLSNQDKTIVVEKPDDDDAVSLLIAEGFVRRDAARLIARTQADAETVRTAIANTRHMLRVGQIKKSQRGYIVRQLENGCTLFGSVRQSRDAAIRNRDRLARLIEAFGDQDDAQAAQAWFYGLGTEQQAKAIRAEELRLADEPLWGIVRGRIEQARQRAGGGQ